MEGLNREMIQLDLHLRKVTLAVMWSGEEQRQAPSGGWEARAEAAAGSWWAVMGDWSSIVGVDLG